jgi:MFS family permease
VLAAGLAGLIAPLIVFVSFTIGRAIYGIWGSASPPAVQAYIAARTEGEQRTNALAAIARPSGSAPSSARRWRRSSSSSRWA